MKKQLGTLLLLSGLATAGFAQEDEGKLTISGQVKNRTEIVNGNNGALKQKISAPGLGTNFRSRLKFSYTKGDVKVVLSPQAIGTYGGQNAILLDDNDLTQGFGMFEAYGQYAKGKATFKFGRQAVVHGDQRILGGLDWAMSGRSHDGITAAFKLGEATKLTSGVIYNSSGNVILPGANNVKESGNDQSEGFQYAWLDTKISDLSLSAVALNMLYTTGDTDPVYTSVFTLGLMPKYKISDNLTLSASLYRQFGGTDIAATEDKKTVSYLYNFDVIAKVGKVGLTVGFDLVSGDNEDTDRSEAFTQNAFGTTHKFYGFQDFYYVGGNDDDGFGIFNPYIKASTKVGKATVLAHLHAFYSSRTRSAIEVESGSFLMNELDLVVKYPVASGFGLAAGASVSGDTKALRELREETTGTVGNVNSWAWLQAMFTF